MRRALLVIASFVTISVGPTTVAPALAAYPGSNGRIFFDTNRFGLPVTQIYSVRQDGETVRQLTHLRAGRVASQPSVSADGRRVVFVVRRDGENDQLWLMRSDGTHAHPITAEPSWAHDNPVFTPDGARIVFSRCGPYVPGYFTCRIFSIATDGSDRRLIVGGLWHPIEVSISPDGSTIAYASDKGGYDSRLWLVGIDGSDPRVIVSGFKVVERPSWSPDGSSIAFGGLKHAIRVYRVDPDGTDLTVVATRGTFPSWSPDGGWIAFFSERDRRMDVVRPDGSDVHALMRRTDDPGAGDSDWGVAP